MANDPWQCGEEGLDAVGMSEALGGSCIRARHPPTYRVVHLLVRVPVLPVVVVMVVVVPMAVVVVVVAVAVVVLAVVVVVVACMQRCSG